MGECARCGDVTDNPARGEYRYCDDCQATFDRIRRHGVVVTQVNDRYRVQVPASGKYSDGREETEVDALTRAKFVADDLGTDALFVRQATGERWLLEEYLEAHPADRSDVEQQLSRIPDDPRPGLVEIVKEWLRKGR